MFIKTFLSKANVTLLGAKGFSLNPFADQTDKHQLVFYNQINQDLYAELLFAKRGSDQVDVIIFLSSKSVAALIAELSLYESQAERVLDRPECVLAVDLAWLVWNKEPATWEKGQFPYFCEKHSDISKVISDYDHYGAEFIAFMAAGDTLAKWLANLAAYPVQVNVPGGLRSADPYIYSALLYLAKNDTKSAATVLSKGLEEYEALASSLEWRKIKLDKFKIASAKILQKIDRINQ